MTFSFKYVLFGFIIATSRNLDSFLNLLDKNSILLKPNEHLCVNTTSKLVLKRNILYGAVRQSFELLSCRISKVAKKKFQPLKKFKPPAKSLALNETTYQICLLIKQFFSKMMWWTIYEQQNKTK